MFWPTMFQLSALIRLSELNFSLEVGSSAACTAEQSRAATARAIRYFPFFDSKLRYSCIRGQWPTPYCALISASVATE